MTASGTAGHGAELARYVDLSSIGAVVVKSMCAEPWPGNPPPRVHETPAGMINSVGLQGQGVDRLAATTSCRRCSPPAPGWWPASGAARSTTTPAWPSCWPTRPATVVAVEVNVSCPNVEDRGRMFAHSPDRTAEVVAAAGACGRPRWAKLSPNVTDLVPIAARGPRRRRRGGHAHQHRDGHGHRRRAPGARCWAAAGGACRARPSTRSPCGPSTTCTPPCPTCPSSGVGGVRQRRRRRSSCCWPAPRPCRWAPPPSPIPGPSPRCRRGVEQWCRRHGVAAVRGPDRSGARPVHGTT